MTTYRYARHVLGMTARRGTGVPLGWTRTCTLMSSTFMLMISRVILVSKTVDCTVDCIYLAASRIVLQHLLEAQGARTTVRVSEICYTLTSSTTVEVVGTQAAALRRIMFLLYVGEFILLQGEKRGCQL